MRRFAAARIGGRAKRRGRFPLICYFDTLAVAWTLADLAGSTICCRVIDS
jgi:hypothetical protein